MTREKAEKVYGDLVKSKMAKGYTPGEAGTPFMATDKAERFTGILPQLLNSIDETELEPFFTDDNFWFQEKHEASA